MVLVSSRKMIKIPKSPQIKSILSFIVVAIVFYFIFRKLTFNWDEFVIVLKEADRILLLLSFVSLALAFVLPIYIWQHLVNTLYLQKIGFMPSYIITVIGNISRYIPGKVWFLVGISYISDQFELSREKGVVSFLFTQLFNLIAAVVIGVLFVRKGLITIPFWTIFFLLLGVGILLQPKYLHNFVKFILRVKHTSAQVPSLGISTIAFSLCLQCIQLTLTGLSLYLIILSFGFEWHWKTLTETVGAWSLSYLLGYLSFFVPAGLGVREGTLILLLPDNFSETLKLSVAMGFRVFVTIVEIAHSIIAFWLYQNLQRRKT